MSFPGSSSISVAGVAYDPERDLAVTAHDVPVRSTTNGYDYTDCTVTLLVGECTYNVSRSRLTLRSPVFRDMFGLPQPASLAPSSPPTSPHSELAPGDVKAESDGDIFKVEPKNPAAGPVVKNDSQLRVVRLYHDVEEFEHYLWSIHADYLEIVAFAQEPASAEKCMRLLCIASVAHQYESTRLANRSLGDAFLLLEKHPNLYINADLATRVVLTPSRWADAPDVVARSRKIVIAAMQNNSIDTLSVIFSAEPLNDHELLGWAYYYLLKDDAQAWRKDPRLRDVDFRRITAGAFALANEWHQLCRTINFGTGINPRVPAWAIFDRLPHADDVQYYDQNAYYFFDSAAKSVEIEQKLFTFFDYDV